jgi:hypothetical protein
MRLRRTPGPNDAARLSGSTPSIVRGSRTSRKRASSGYRRRSTTASCPGSVRIRHPVVKMFKRRQPRRHQAVDRDFSRIAAILAVQGGEQGLAAGKVDGDRFSADPAGLAGHIGTRAGFPADGHLDHPGAGPQTGRRFHLHDELITVRDRGAEATSRDAANNVRNFTMSVLWATWRRTAASGDCGLHPTCSHRVKSPSLLIRSMGPFHRTPVAFGPVRARLGAKAIRGRRCWTGVGSLGALPFSPGC